MTTHMTKTWFVDGQIIEEPIPEAEMNTNFSGNLHEVMHQAAWDSATRVPEGDIRALKHRIHELEGEVIGYKQILDTQPEPAQCDGGQCGIGGYCKECPKAQLEQEPVAYLCENAVGHKYFRWKKPSSEYKPIALYTAHASPQRIWQGLTDEEVVDRANAEVFAEAFARGAAWAELKLKEKNT